MNTITELFEEEMIKLIKITLCILCGYLIGSLNPSALIAKIKKVNLRKKGTGNLGATNAMLVLGKKYGALVLLFDISKAALCVILANMILDDIFYAGLLCGGFAVVGHIFPFYLKFKGGKGFAPFAGTILAFDPLSFLFLFIVCIGIMFAVNYTVGLTWSSALLFPVTTAIRTSNPILFILSLLISTLIITKHYENLTKALRGEDVKVRPYLKKVFKA